LERNFDVDVFHLWLSQFEGNTPAVQKMINHTHIYDMFDACTEAVGEEIFEQLAHAVATSWRIVLNAKCPEIDFVVDVSNTDQDYGPTITFFQKN
jgi:hypothetical protein